MFKVLIAEDDPVSSRILEKSVKKWGFDVLLSKDGGEAWKAFQNQEIRIAILDWMMPKIDGVELCRRIRKEKREKYTYIILLTAKGRREDVVEGLSNGADDYIIKPFNPMELNARLQTGRRIIELENQLIDSQKKLKELATRDSLTNLWNRRTILQLLDEELNRSQRENNPLGIIMIDVDDFKKINDTCGHLIGDMALRSVALALKKSVRHYDKIGRYGGDEFLIVLPNCTLDNVKKIAERLRLDVFAKKVKSKAGSLQISISLGGSSTETRPKIGADKLIISSDKALYEAKNKGRNCSVILI